MKLLVTRSEQSTNEKETQNVKGEKGCVTLLMQIAVSLEDTEGLLSGNHTLGFVGDNVESDSLGKGTALTKSDDISFLDSEGRSTVSGNISVTLFKTTVLLNIVQVIPSDNNCALHLGRDDNSLQDGTTDGNISSEGALFVDKVSFNGCARSLDSKTNILDKAHRLVLLTTNSTLASHEDGCLLLVSLLSLVAF